MSRATKASCATCGWFEEHTSLCGLNGNYVTPGKSRQFCVQQHTYKEKVRPVEISIDRERPIEPPLRVTTEIQKKRNLFARIFLREKA